MRIGRRGTLHLVARMIRVDAESREDTAYHAIVVADMVHADLSPSSEEGGLGRRL